MGKCSIHVDKKHWDPSCNSLLSRIRARTLVCVTQICMCVTIMENILLSFVLLCSCCNAEVVVYPAESGSCPSEPCLTLEDCVNNASHYFTSNTSFIFLPGEHSLEDTLALHGVVNVTLRGADRRARITVSSGGVISCSCLERVPQCPHPQGRPPLHHIHYSLGKIQILHCPTRIHCLGRRLLTTLRRDSVNYIQQDKVH